RPSASLTLAPAGVSTAIPASSAAWIMVSDQLSGASAPGNASASAPCAKSWAIGASLQPAGQCRAPLRQSISSIARPAIIPRYCFAAALDVARRLLHIRAAAASAREGAAILARRRQNKAHAQAHLHLVEWGHPGNPV